LFFNRLASFTRLIRFDRRGTSASERLPLESLPSWESYAEELQAVLDEVGSERSAIMASLDGGPMAMLFAATYPERTIALILANTSTRLLEDDGYPGVSPSAAAAMLERMEELWGTEGWAAVQIPSRAGDERFTRWYAKMIRAIGSRAAAQAYYRAGTPGRCPSDPELDPGAHADPPSARLRDHPVRPGALPRRAHRGGAAPGAPRRRWQRVLGDAVSDLDAVEEFSTGVRGGGDPQRILATVLFTDIVASTERAAELGDRRWREILDVHDDISRREVERSRGRLIKTTGDGIFATFDGPGRAIQCASAIALAVRGLGIEIRAGVHTGEVEMRGEDVGGIAVHIGARVMDRAGPGEILVSRTVRDLIAGSDLILEDRGIHALKDVEGAWQLFGVSHAGAALGA